MDLKEYIRHRTEERPVFMPYLTVGDPSFDKTIRFAEAMIEAGADLMELGIPFSDPTADGPVIQAAMVRSMSHSDFSVAKVFEVARAIHEKHPEVPLIFLTYFNPVINSFPPESTEKLSVSQKMKRSIENFLVRCKEAGVQGLVIPDLPHDQPEAALIRSIGEPLGVYQIMMVAPTTEPKRKREICKLARGFIYYVTSLGVTGERKEFPPDMEKKIREVQKLSGLPILAGFGFTHPDQARPLTGITDGVIVGSYNHTLIQEKGEGALQALAENTRGFVEALKREN